MSKFFKALIGFIAAIIMWFVEGLFWLIVITVLLLAASMTIGVLVDTIIYGFNAGRDFL